jgi:hypothetical protein
VRLRFYLYAIYRWLWMGERLNIRPATGGIVTKVIFNCDTETLNRFLDNKPYDIAMLTMATARMSRMKRG